MNFFYELPGEKIAQRPVCPPESAKFLCIDRKQSCLQDSTFSELPALLDSSDVLVFNRSAVIPARLNAKLETSKIELLLLRPTAARTWTLLAKPLRKLQPGGELWLSDKVQGQVVERPDLRSAVVRFNVDDHELLALGTMPIPPYIREGRSDEQDIIDYQNVFADKAGSVAAPTAGLHFSKALLERLSAKKIDFHYVTLHVGAASFLPLLPGTPPGVEHYEYDASLLETLRSLKGQGRRVIAVGTTSVRALESMARHDPSSGSGLVATDLFIQPGFEFKIISGLITNFHQPSTTHLALVEAFMGRELLQRSYQHALKSNYRFLSYGDGMMVL